MSAELAVEDLHVRFRTGSDTVHAVNGASFEIAPGETVGLVGESGCGKSVTARSIVRLEGPGQIVDGSIRFDGQELTTADDRTLRRLRGRELAMVFQDPSTTLNPVYSIGEQIAEALRVHRRPDNQPFFRELARGASSRLRSRTTRSRVLELLETVGIPRPEERVDAYPHEFSGGMRQRAMLAIALARRPSLLIADEPTTGLDTTTQSAILDRLADLNESTGMGVLLISHDLGVVSKLCDRVVVMYDGVVVERGPVEDVRSNPAHPYTKALLGCLPHRSEPQSRLPTVGGTPPDDSAPPTGCVFVDRCPFATADCRESSQPVVPMGDDHAVRCGVSGARAATLESMRAKTDGLHDERSRSAGCSDENAEAATTAADGGPITEPATVTNGTAGLSSQSERADQPVVELEGVTKSFRKSDALVDRLPWFGTDQRVRAVRGVSLELRAGETLGLVGESGCGKSTLARLLTGLEKPTGGTVRLRDEAVGGVRSRTSEQLAEIGTVFQNPGASLNPKRTVGESIAEPLSEAGWTKSRRDDRIDELLSVVGLPLECAGRYPRRLSGGQRQRVAIARAIALEPSVLVLDEPTSALDVSTQATVLNLLADLQEELGLAYLFISHDLDVVRNVADRVATMYLGKLVEVGPASRTFSNPTHPYTRTLLDASPGSSAEGSADGAQPTAESPSPSATPDGCAFRARCPVATEECARIEPSLESVGEATSRCLYAPDWRIDERTDHEQT